jgi:hypothetical protein
MILIERLAAAIACQEGWFEPLKDGKPNVPQSLNNPGDLMFAGQTGATEDRDPDFAYWHTPQAGIVGLYRDLLAKIAKGLTLREVIEVWAPPSENDTEVYLRNVQTWTGITDATVPLLRYVEPLQDPRIQRNAIHNPTTPTTPIMSQGDTDKSEGRNADTSNPAVETSGTAAASKDA